MKYIWLPTGNGMCIYIPIFEEGDPLPDGREPLIALALVGVVCLLMYCFYFILSP